ncbi:MAG: protein-L-isoaspartate(D-aspartate) O-methyltransferase [Mesorhizobium sp.]
MARPLCGMPSATDIPLLPDSELLRQQMVDWQLMRRGIADQRVLDAMRKVPREAFVPSGIARGAYDDCALPIEAGQTISQPYIVALMAEAANLKAEDRVLEIGTGSGYAAAVFSLLVARVYTIERHALLAEMAERRLQALGYNNIEVRAGNGMVGWPEAAPFEAILVAASGTQVPETWKRQLTASGRLIMPLGGKSYVQELIKLTRTGKDKFKEENLGDVMFVPLISDPD